MIKKEIIVRLVNNVLICSTVLISSSCRTHSEDSEPWKLAVKIIAAAFFCLGFFAADIYNNNHKLTEDERKMKKTTVIVGCIIAFVLFILYSLLCWFWY